MLTTREVAARYGVTAMAVRIWCHAGRLPGARLVGRDWMIPETALVDFERPARGWRKGRTRKPPD